MIPLKVHNVLDYVAGVVLVLCPMLFGFSAVDVARNTFVTLGIGLIGYSLLTRYRYSIAKVIPLGAHMVLDVLAGGFLMIAPWVLGYRAAIADTTLGLHFVLGLGVWALVAFTSPKSERQARRLAGPGEPVSVTETDERRRAA